MFSNHGACFMRVAFAGVALLLVGCATEYNSHKNVVVPEGWPGPNCSGLYGDYFKPAGDGQFVAATDSHARTSLFSNMCLSNEDRSKRLTFGVIEFDDEGTHWNRDQFDRVREVIESIGKAQAQQYPAAKEDPPATFEGGNSTLADPEDVRSEGIFLVAFVHGWRHSAAERSTSLQQFRWFARELADSDEICDKEPVPDSDGGGGDEASGSCRSRPHVVAVYLAWRGQSARALGGRLAWPELLSFWGRKAAALRVAGTPMTETLFGMLDALEKADDALADGLAASGLDTSRQGPVRSRSMIIGHSFGARVVENAFAQALIGSRLESQRVSSYRLRKAVDSATKAKKDVVGAENAVKALDERLALTQADRSTNAAAVETASDDLSDAQEQLAGLVTWEQANMRFAPYRSPSLGMTGASYCREFDGSRVERCVGTAQDVWRAGTCVVDEVACLYRSYACSIHSETARRAKDAPTSSDMSEWCTTGWASLETERKRLEESGEGEAVGENGDDEPDPLMVIGEGDEVAEWKALALALKENHDGLPLPVVGEKSDDGVPDWGPARTYLEQVTHWTDSWDLWARIVAAWETASGGVTKGVREGLLEEIDRARSKSAALLSGARDDLAEVELLEDELGRRSHVRDEVTRLEGELVEAQSLLRETEDALTRLAHEIDEAKKAENSAKNSLRSASVAVAQQVDSTLRPPADLILLVNPATEALSARNLIYALCSTEKEVEETISEARRMLTDESQQILERRPWIVSVTSTGDEATGRHFPRAVMLARLVGGKRNRTFVEVPGTGNCVQDLGSYEDMVVRTAGHSEDMVTHEVALRRTGRRDRNPCDRRPDPGGVETPASDVLFETRSGATLARKARRDPAREAFGRKYWIAEADPAISRDHNDVFNEHTLGLTTALICHARLFDSLCPAVDEESVLCVAGGAAAPKDGAGWSERGGPGGSSIRASMRLRAPRHYQRLVARSSNAAGA